MSPAPFEPDWAKLRAKLLEQFDEDIVQQVILELLEEQRKGTWILDPLRWCRMRAKSRVADKYRALAVEREAAEAMTAFGTIYPEQRRYRTRGSHEAA